ncbi:amidohydrolase family protein [Flavisolibacter sp. BT320]|nr:amidohydrolase family protein [Flavisolibacter longurius]
MFRLLFLFLQIVSGITARPQEGKLIFYDATIVDVQSGKLLAHKEVIVSGGKILRVQPISKSTAHKDAQIINAKGKFIVPGFWDMHTHVLMENNYRWQFPLLLANGIIGIREMWGRNMRLADSLKKEMTNERLPYFHFTAPGHIIDGKSVFYPGQLSAPDTTTAIRLVDSLIREKVDFIKIYSYLDEEVFEAIAKRCRQMKIQLAGHVPHTVWVSKAAAAGMASMEHLYGFLIEACAYPDSAMMFRKTASVNFEKGMPAKLRILNARAGETFMLKHFSEKRMRALARTLKKHNTYVVPTVVTNRGKYFANDTVFTNDKRMEFLTEDVRSYWKETVKTDLANYSSEDWQNFRKRNEVEKTIIKILAEESVNIMAGTDFDNPFAFPGFGLHDEIALYVAFGMKPIDALRTITINPVRYLNMTDSLGTIQNGKRADFVLLNGNPLTDIAQTKNIFAVMHNGKLYTAGELEELKANVRRRNKLTN